MNQASVDQQQNYLSFCTRLLSALAQTTQHRLTQEINKSTSYAYVVQLCAFHVCESQISYIDQLSLPIDVLSRCDITDPSVHLYPPFLLQKIKTCKRYCKI